ncbi:HD domain-containing protein [Candidatus Sumerlaeota bacterium]|nr:HD domain-containing protein [Candidatus Sumerlaeota bacterium]
MSSRPSRKPEARRAMERMALLMLVSDIVIGNAPLSEQMQEIARHVHEAFGVTACVLRELHHDGLHLLASSGFHMESLPAVLDPQKGIAGRMIADKLPLIITNVPADSLTAKLHASGGPIHFQSFAGAPMIVHGEVIGLLGVYSAEQQHQFTGEDLEHLQLVANHVGVSVLNARLFREVTNAYERTLEGWSAALEYRDPVTKGHTMRVTELTVRLAREMNWDESNIIHLRRGAMLHDIGKMAIPDEILMKPGPLTREETLIMRQHPEIAREMLEPIEFLRPALDIPLNHHERWNGSGYPRGLRGEMIPPAARLFSVVDVWDAMCSDRPYRKALAPSDARDYLKENAGILFDESAVASFLKVEAAG